MVIISPMTVAPVCRIGDPLILTCRAPMQLNSLKWSILQANELGILEKVANDVKVTFNQTIRPFSINSASFSFSRVDQ